MNQTAENQIVIYLMASEGMACTIKDIAAECNLGESTVKEALKRLLEMPEPFIRKEEYVASTGHVNYCFAYIHTKKP